MTRQPSPSAGSPRDGFPYFLGTMSCSDSPTPVPVARRLATGYRGCPRRLGVSQVPGGPHSVRALLSDPGGARWERDHCLQQVLPTLAVTTPALTTIRLSGLDNTARTIAAYA